MDRENKACGRVGAARINGNSAGNVLHTAIHPPTPVHARRVVGMSTNPGGLFLGPVRRPLKADSDFFVAGNTNRELLCKISVFSIISAGCDAMDLAEHEQSYECMFQGCPATFSSFQRVSLDWPMVLV